MRRIIAPLIAALCLPTAVMAASPMPSDGLARIEMQVETDFLTPEERQVVNLLIKAADEMTVIYRRQSAGEGPGHGFYPLGLSKAELDAYIAYSESPAGQQLNAALFAAFDGVFTPVSKALGLAVARELQGQDI